MNFIEIAHAAPNAQVASTSLLDLLTASGPMAKFVLALLLAASIFCWTIIVSKLRTLGRANKQNRQFLDLFWHGKNIDEIFAKSDKFPSSPVAAIFRSGVKELKRLSGSEVDAIRHEGVENVQRALVRASNSEIAALERQVGWLATTASAAPFVGLFGTVWGIMNSFQNIGATGAANLAVVAPGISEALVATAAGIGAAIPAVIAYNHFAGQIKRLATDMDCFAHDFLNIVQRSVSSAGGKKS
jgi:biopolymer transport protein TolQ